MPNTEGRALNAEGRTTAGPFSFPFCTHYSAFTTLHSPRAFTLVEMLVVLAIIGLVAAMSVPMILPFMRGRKLGLAADVVKSACVLARSKAIQQKRMINVTLLEQTDFQHGGGVIITDYEKLRDAVGGDPQKPFCAHYLGNYLSPDDRFAQLRTNALERVRYLPEGCRFDLDGDNSDTTGGWTYIFLPTGGVWTLPANAENKRDNWSQTTYLAEGRPSGPVILGPGEGESVTVIVYATTGQAVSEE